MGLMDKVREQAAVASAVAKDAAQKGQAKVGDIQAKRVADSLLRDLGAATYAQASGRATEQTPGDIARVTAALRAHEVEHGPIPLVLESTE